MNIHSKSDRLTGEVKAKGMWIYTAP